jgi:hypothetical protein
MEALSTLILWGLFLQGTDGKPVVPEPIAVGVGMQFLKPGMTKHEVESLLHLGNRRSCEIHDGYSRNLDCLYPPSGNPDGPCLILHFLAQEDEAMRLRSGHLEQGDQVIRCIWLKP